MAKNNKKWDGVERRKEAKSYSEGDKRKNNTTKVNADFVPTKNDERYQFENLVIYYRARFNVWQVLNMKLSSYEQLLFEVVGYANQMDAFMWAKDYIKELNNNETKKGE